MGTFRNGLVFNGLDVQSERICCPHCLYPAVSTVGVTIAVLFCCYAGDALEISVKGRRFGEAKHKGRFLKCLCDACIDESFRPTILQPLRPQVMTEKQHVVGYTFENMTPQAERFVREKFKLNKRDSINTNLEQQITTSMRMDLFYQTAECRLVPEGDGVRVILSAGNRKSVQLHAGVRYDNEEYASVQVGLDIPFKTAIPINSDITLRLGKRLMARGELTVHPLSITQPTLIYSFRRNDIDVYLEGERDNNIQFNQFQAEFIPINHYLRHFNIQYGLRWDYFHYRNKLGSETSKDVSLKNENFYSYHARINYNSEDNWCFPARGVRFKAEYSYLTDNLAKLDGKTGMSEADANWRMSFSFGSRFTLSLCSMDVCSLAPLSLPFSATPSEESGSDIMWNSRCHSQE